MHRCTSLNPNMCWRILMAILGMVALVCIVGGDVTALEDVQPDIEVFIRTGYPHCEAARVFLKELRRERPTLRILIHDLHEEPEAMARFKDLADKLEVRHLGVPAFYLRSEWIIGYDQSGQTDARIRSLLESPSPQTTRQVSESTHPPTAITSSPQKATAPISDLEGVTVPFFGRVTVQELGLPLFTFAIGLLDGFNPCSMWVMVFMLALLASLHDRPKMLLIAGTFVAVEGLAYFAFMAAWLNVFLLVGLSRLSEVILGGIASAAGVITVKEFWAFRHEVSLEIPEAAKPWLHTKIRDILQAKNLTTALVGAVVLAVLVQVVEFFCTAGFPALYTRVLTMRQLEWSAYYGYLLLYNIA